jgi:hypothetical protein
VKIEALKQENTKQKFDTIARRIVVQTIGRKEKTASMEMKKSEDETISR